MCWDVFVSVWDLVTRGEGTQNPDGELLYHSDGLKDVSRRITSVLPALSSNTAQNVNNLWKS